MEPVYLPVLLSEWWIHDDAIFKGQQNATGSYHKYFTSDNGSEGTKIEYPQVIIIICLTINSDDSMATDANTNGMQLPQVMHSGHNWCYGDCEGYIVSFASEDTSTACLGFRCGFNGFLKRHLSNIAFLRAQAGGGMSRLNFAADSIAPTPRICVPQSEELRMWISHWKVQIWQSTASCHKPLPPWSLRQIHPMMLLSCCLGNG